MQSVLIHQIILRQHGVNTLLPSTRMSLPGCCLSWRTASTTFSRMIVEFRQAEADFKVVDTTYLGMVFIASPNGITSLHRFEGASVDLPGFSS